MNKVVLQAHNITKSFHQGSQLVEVLKGASLDIEQGQMVGLVGQSGSGKSTFLQIIGLLDRPDSGTITINGTACDALADAKRTEIRRQDIGVVYQFHHLLPEFSAAENIMIPQMVMGVSKADANLRALDLLEKLGLGNRATHRPAELSGGEQQRVAIARAMANHPSLLLADEPTGNLDPQTSAQVYRLLLDLAKQEQVAVLFVTHNQELASYMDKVLVIRQGLITSE